MRTEHPAEEYLRRRPKVPRVVHCELLESRRLLSVVYVDANSPGMVHDGASWATAYKHLQSALSAAVSGDTIEVAQGTYKPTTGTDRTASFGLKDGVAIEGGYAGDLTASPGARNVKGNPTILSGDIGVAGDSSDNSYHVVFGQDVDATASLDGFTITGGAATPTASSDDLGGGMLLMNASPTLSRCIFSDNSAYSGGGINNQSSSPTLTNCAFTGNSASYGGAMTDNTSSPTLTNCMIEGNTATELAGGMYNVSSSSPILANCTFNGNSQGGMDDFSSSPTLTNCIFTGNHGSGIVNGSSSPTLTNCTFSANTGSGMFDTSSSPVLMNCRFISNIGDGVSNGTSSPSFSDCLFVSNTGGGMFSTNSSTPSLTNCVFSGNSSGGMTNDSASPTLLNCSFIANSGGALANFSSTANLFNCTFEGNTGGLNIDDGGTSSVTLTNCILWDNSGVGNNEFYNGSPSVTTVTYSDIEGGFTGTGNINSDPLFVDATGENLQLQVGSPAIDAGNTSALPAGDTTDLAGNPRVFNGVVDMGAYEYPGAGVPVFTGAVSAEIPVGMSYSLVVSTTGASFPPLSESGELPSGLTFRDNGNGTATLYGTPADGTKGTYILTLTADGGANATDTQTFALTVGKAPAITSAGHATFVNGASNTFTVAASGYPAAAFTEVGALPSGVKLVDNHNGTATVSGTAATASGGVYSVTIKAKDGLKPNAKQVFVLTVSNPPSISSASSATFHAGGNASFAIDSTGFPEASITESGALPAGITLQDNNDGTAILTGVPAPGSEGVYDLTLKAKNGVKPNASQVFTLTILG